MATLGATVLEGGSTPPASTRPPLRILDFGFRILNSLSLQGEGEGEGPVSRPDCHSGRTEASELVAAFASACLLIALSTAS